MAGRSVIPGGESGDKNDPHYNDQAVMYLNNQTHDSYFDVPDVVDHADGRIVFQP
jgi:acyl-homoserine lactone acylase PvdQ